MDVADLYHQHGARLFRVAVAILGSEADAEDALQDSLVAIAVTPPQWGAIRDVGSYLVTCVRHQAVRRLKQQRRRPMSLQQAEHDLAALPTAQGAVEHEPDPELARALRDLPLDQREVLALKFEGGLTFEDIAKTLNVSLNTAASRYRYALDKLRRALKGRNHER